MYSTFRMEICLKIQNSFLFSKIKNHFSILAFGLPNFKNIFFNFLLYCIIFSFNLIFILAFFSALLWEVDLHSFAGVIKANKLKIGLRRKDIEFR